MKIIAPAIVSGLHLRNSKETRAEAGLLQQMDKQKLLRNGLRSQE